MDGDSSLTRSTNADWLALDREFVLQTRYTSPYVLERGRGFRGMGRYLEERFVLEHAIARHVAGLGLLFPPLGRRCQDGEKALVGGTRPQALPRIDRVTSVQQGILQRCNLLFHPRRPSCALQLFGQRFVHDAQMRYVGESVFKLAFG